jgi:hypothetical protein
LEGTETNQELHSLRNMRRKVELRVMVGKLQMKLVNPHEPGGLSGLRERTRAPLRHRFAREILTDLFATP